MRAPVAVLAVLASFSLLGLAASCSSSSGQNAAPVTEAGPAQNEAAAADATTSPPDAGRELPEASCDAAIVECTSTPTQASPTITIPEACGAPEFDAYSTNNSNEQVEAACNDFCVAQNPAYQDAGSAFVGCNQTPAEQALGTGAFHCVCAP